MLPSLLKVVLKNFVLDIALFGVDAPDVQNSRFYQKISKIIVN